MDVQETEWYQAQPPLIQQRIDEYPPHYLYRNTRTGYRVVLYSYDEGEDRQCTTCTVLILQLYNPESIVLERRVFGVLLTDLERLPVQRNMDAEERR